MLYLFDEYVAEYPARATGGLRYFENSPKNLHEMTLGEINEIYSNSPEVSEKTAASHRSIIRLYLKWLQSKGVKCDPTIADEIEHVLIQKKYLIFSTDDLDYYYQVLEDCLTEIAENGGKKISPVSLLMSHAAGILSFYGLTEEEIIALRYDDVQPDGVQGYDLPLTEKDLRYLIDYKECRASNGRPLKGEGYIRSAQNFPINSTFVSRAVWRLKLDATHDYLKSLLHMGNLYQLGVFNRAFEREKKEAKKIIKNNMTPEWFIEMACDDVSPNAVAKTKAKYIDYRTERIETEQKRIEEATSQIEKPKQVDDPVEKQLSIVMEQWQQLGEAIKKLQDLIKR